MINTDTDSYILKCTLEAMEQGVPTEEILKICALQLGLDKCDSNVDSNDKGSANKDKTSNKIIKFKEYKK